MTDKLYHWLKATPENLPNDLQKLIIVSYINANDEDVVKEMFGYVVKELLESGIESGGFRRFEYLAEHQEPQEEKKFTQSDIDGEVVMVQQRCLALLDQKYKKFQTLKQSHDKLVAVLEGYEKWEAELISDDECWGPERMNAFPTLTEGLYDKMIELQEKRNEAFSSMKILTEVDRHSIEIADKSVQD